MKYWFFNGSDVVGPFTPRELAAEKSFNENSLVCPEQFSAEEDHWRPALSFEEFQSLLSPSQPLQSLTLEQEMNTLLKEKSPLAFEKTNTDNSGLQLPKKPAKPGPIEEYFNHIEKEDLGDILGIPAPAENSDMDLAQAIQHQLAKTSSTRRTKQELTPADNQTAQQLATPEELPEAAETHHVATATEVFATRAPVSTALAEPEIAPTTSAELTPLPETEFEGMPTADTAPVLSPVSLANPAAQTAAPVPTEEPATPQAAFREPEPEEIVPAPNAKTEELQQEINQAPQQEPEAEQPQVPPRSEKVETSSINARLKQTQEMKDFLQKQTARPQTAARWERTSLIGLIAVLVILGTIFTLRQLQARPVTSEDTQAQTPATSTAQELLAEVPPATSAPSAPAPAAPLDARQQALNIVQNHTLPGGRGTLVNYLNTIYQTQLSQGYLGTWDAQPLHKSTYVVKYQLTKTRKEPIIYVFQADVAQGKLTGALNNISLDLVGKI